MIATTPLLTRQESAVRLNQSVRTVDKLIENGELPFVKIGRSIRIRPAAVDRFIEARESRTKVKVRKAKKKEAAASAGAAQ